MKFLLHRMYHRRQVAASLGGWGRGVVSMRFALFIHAQRCLCCWPYCHGGNGTLPQFFFFPFFAFSTCAVHRRVQHPLSRTRSGLASCCSGRLRLTGHRSISSPAFRPRFALLLCLAYRHSVRAASSGSALRATAERKRRQTSSGSAEKASSGCVCGVPMLSTARPTGEEVGVVWLTNLRVEKVKGSKGEAKTVVQE